MQFWAAQCKKEKLLEIVQRRDMKVLRALREKQEVAEVTWSVHPGEKEAEGGPQIQ